jgi:hypothetical protein
VVHPAAALWPPFVARHPQAAGKGTHALVIGVSAYDNLPPPGGKAVAPWQLVQLQSAATAGLLFAEWLNEHYHSGEGAPLQSLRVLLSPSKAEGQRIANRLGGAPTATSENVKHALRAWSADLVRSRGSTSLIYLAGHGVFANGAQRNLLLQDLSPEPYLDESINITSVLGSLTHFQLDASYAFIDTCSDSLSLDRKWGSGGLELGHDFTNTDNRRGDHRFFAAARGGKAKGHIDIGSIFGHGLRVALGSAVTRTPDGTWAVTPQILADRLSDWATGHGVDFVVEPSFKVRLSFQIPERDPKGTIKVTLAPPAGAPHYTLGVLDQNLKPEFPRVVFDPHPWTHPVEPGIHTVRLTRGGDPPLERSELVEVYQVQEYSFQDDQR